MSKNKFSQLPVLPAESDLGKIVCLFEYKRVYRSELPNPLNTHPLTEKCNSFLLASSGTTQTEVVYTVIGIRPDKGDVIDEHPFVFTTIGKISQKFWGIIHHGDWPGRTVSMKTWQTEALARSGLTAEFTYKSIPPDGFGSLYDLHENGMLEGITKQFEMLFKNLRKHEAVF